MNWTRALTIVALLFVLLFFVPTIPTSVFYYVSASTYDFEDVRNSAGLSQDDVGFQGIGLLPLGFTEECPDCTAAAFSSVRRDTFDGASTMCFLAKGEGVWQIRQVRDGVTGTPLIDE